MLENYLRGEGAVGWIVGLVVLVVAFGVTLFHFLMEPMRWRAAYLPASGKEINPKPVRDVLYCTSLATYLLPFKIGIPMRLGMLRHMAGLDLSFVAAILAFDAVVSLCVWAGAATLSAWFAALHWQFDGVIWLGAGGIAIAISVMMVTRKWFAAELMRRWHAVSGLIHDLRRSVGVSILILAWDVGSYWVRHALLIFLTTGSIRMMAVGGAAGVIATFAGIVSGMPMGLVGYDATLIALLGAAGVRMDQALAVAIINRGLTFVAAVTVGVPAGIRLGLGIDMSSTLRGLREIGNEKK